jgi:hypothetical protein
MVGTLHSRWHGRLFCCRNLAFDVTAEEGRAADQTQTFRCEGAGVRVSFQAKEIAGELYRIKPAVRCCARWQLVELLHSKL